MAFLKKARARYSPPLPPLLETLERLAFVPEERGAQAEVRLQKVLPHLCNQPFLHLQKGEKRSCQPKKVGVLFSGGPAPGGHNVLAGLLDALTRLHAKSTLIGFLGGPGGLIQGEAIEITKERLAPYRNQGGFDLIGSGRTKIETEEQFASCLEVVRKQQLDGLVIIGGDDSNTNAAFLAEYFLANGCHTCVIGVPKTIDGDLKSARVPLSFGFDTAAKTYAEMIGNICRDAASARKYYHFIKLMGRSASHITLECALTTEPTCALIAEEVLAQKKTLVQIAEEIADSVCAREKQGKNYGVILVPEGLIEFIPEVRLLIQELNTALTQGESGVSARLSPSSKACLESLPESIQKQLLLTRDPHGNVQVSLIETEQLLAKTVEKALLKRQKEGKFHGTFSAQCHFFGYEGRAAYPSNFDCNYCYSLGHVAALLVEHNATGYMGCVLDLHLPVASWRPGGVPLSSLMHFETRKGKERAVIQKALVDLQGAPFQHFERSRSLWASQDGESPGPIQFFGPAEATEAIPVSLRLEAD